MMDLTTLSYILFPILITIFFLHKFVTETLNKSKLLPPGPKRWPIIGNIHHLGDKPHQTVANLSKLHGPIMTLKLGTVTTIVITSSDIAKEMFIKHDLAFSSRAFLDAIKETNHDKHSMVWLPVGPKWRNFRKIATVQPLTSHKLDESQTLRQYKVNELIEHVRHCCNNDAHVEIGKVGFTTVLNLLSNTFFSMDLASHESLYSREFKDLVWDLLEEVGRPNVSDFFPMVRRFDLQGVSKRIKEHFLKMFGIFEKIMDERSNGGDELGFKDDVLDTLLKLFKDGELSLDDVKHMLLDLFVAGTDTTSSTLEWAMTELLRNPEKMSKAQNELDQIIGKNDSVKESDITNLPYIQAIVKETLRLHPPAPFLVPHKAEKDVELSGYLIPKNAQIWVNVWSIGRDPSVWPNPQSFSPERFMESEIDVKGRDFELIPFGAGRRICPGMPLAHRMVHLMLASLLHSFNWKHAHGLNPQDIDVEEKFGITLQKVQPLQAIPFIR